MTQLPRICTDVKLQLTNSSIKDHMLRTNPTKYYLGEKYSTEPSILLDIKHTVDCFNNYKNV